MMKTLRSLVWRYGFALVAFALPLLLSWGVRQWHLSFDSTWLLIIALLVVSWLAGRGPGLAMAAEAALKLKETNGLHAEPVSAARRPMIGKSDGRTILRRSISYCC